MLITLLFTAALAEPRKISGSLGPCNQVDSSELFTQAHAGWSEGLIFDDLKGMVSASEAALNYLRSVEDSTANHAGLFHDIGITIADVENSLELITATYKSNKDTLNSTAWWEEQFELWWWNPAALPCASTSDHSSIRLTKYVIYEGKGCREKRPECPQALWALPDDERHLTEEEAAKNLSLLRHDITRQQVVNGIFEHKHRGRSTPLAWVSEETLYDALMQGTVRIRFNDNSVQHYNVHRPNRYKYQHGTPSSEQQRFWYFREVIGPVGWGNQAANRIPIFDYGVVAGDVQNLGLGKLFLLHSETRSSIVVLADTGGAFEGNLRQLDWFVGATPTDEVLNQKLLLHPSYVQAGLLIKRTQN